jgi:hypothetical protein
MAMVKEVSDRYTEEKSKWLDEILLPHQLERLEQCRYWLAFKLRPTWVLQDHVKASNSPLVEVQAVYDEYFGEAIELHREYRVKKAEVYEKNLKKSELEQLVKLGDKPTLDAEDREWIRRVIIPKVRDDMAALNEKLQEGQQKLFNLAQMKMLDCLTSAERTRWHKRAGVRVEFPTHPNEIIERIGNDKYSPDGRGKNLRPYTPRRPLRKRPSSTD